MSRRWPGHAARLMIILLANCAPRSEPGPASPGPDPAFFAAERIGPDAPRALRVAWSQSYRGAMPHSAFALAWDPANPRIAWGIASGAATPAAARQRALENCRNTAVAQAPPCRVFATDATLETGDARESLATGQVGPFRRSPLHRVHSDATGAIIWSHGFTGSGGAEASGTRSAGVLGIFNEAGWDILRFDRLNNDDALENALPRLVRGLGAARAAGYRRIVLAGQSRGGWHSALAAAARPDLVDAVIAIAPAAHSAWNRGNNLGAARDDFRSLLRGLPDDRVRLAVVVFDDDDFDPDPAWRAQLVARLAAQRRAPTLAIWPEDGLVGHSAGFDWRFADTRAGCLFALVTAPDAAAPRGLQRGPCARPDAAAARPP